MQEAGSHILGEENLPSKIQQYLCFRVVVSALQGAAYKLSYKDLSHSPGHQLLNISFSQPPLQMTLLVLIKHPFSLV